MARMMAVTFTPRGRLYYVDPGAHEHAVGDHVLVPTSTGPEVAQVVWGPEPTDEPVGGLPVSAGPADRAALDRDGANRSRRARIQVVAQRLVREAGLPMKVLAVDWADVGHEAGRPTATVYFSAPHRVDFRDLVRNLAHALDCKVVLTQLGARDTARVLGGIGPCGRDTCCSTFLVDFEPVSLRMARDQDLPVNPMKISGACGRLMCCLKYEHPLYQDFKAEAPEVGLSVDLDEGEAVVVGHDVPRDNVVMKLRADGRRVVCDRAHACAARAAYESR